MGHPPGAVMHTRSLVGYQVTITAFMRSNETSNERAFFLLSFPKGICV
jgi:hypothetical protein